MSAQDTAATRPRLLPAADPIYFKAQGNFPVRQANSLTRSLP
jgi:hypothetical protein